MKPKTRLLTLVTLLSAISVGCTSGLFSTVPYVDSHRDENGNVVMEDTPRMWQEFVDSVEPRIIAEKNGRVPEAGLETWVEYWRWRIKIFSQYHENREKYINYIITRRRQEGLPELEGQPE